MNQQRKTIYALRRQVLEGRYAPEPTEEEKKQGKTAVDARPPEESGKHTTESLAKTVRPMLARMCESAHRGARARSERPGRFLRREGGAAADASCARPSTSSTAPIPIRRASLEDRTATLDRLADEVGVVVDPAARAAARSVARRCCRGSSTNTARPTPTPRTGIWMRCARRSRSASTSSPPSTRARSWSARRSSSRCGPTSRR